MKKVFIHIIIFALIILFYFLPFTFNGNKEEIFISDSLFNMVIKYFNEGNLSRSKALLKELFSIQPEYAVNHFYLGYIYYKESIFDSSLIYFESCIEKDPEFYDAYFYLGNIYCDKGYFNDGIKYLKSAIELNPYYLNAYRALAKHLLKIGYLKDYQRIQRRIDILESKR